MKEWKKKNRVDDKQKVFIIDKGGYRDVRKALKRRGWVENLDAESPCFDLKWSLKIKDIAYDSLEKD